MNIRTLEYKGGHKIAISTFLDDEGFMGYVAHIDDGRLATCVALTEQGVIVRKNKEARIARLRKLYFEIRRKELLCNWQTRLLFCGIILYCGSLFVSQFLKWKG